MNAAELLSAYAAGQRDFVDADLYGANLTGADLRVADLYGADLTGADPLNCMGLYSARGPFMSSRHDTLYGGVFERDGAIVLLLTAGCATMKTADELRVLVRETHGDNAHAVQYEAAISFIEACFASDLAAGRFSVKAAEEVTE